MCVWPGQIIRTNFVVGFGASEPHFRLINYSLGLWPRIYSFRGNTLNRFEDREAERSHAWHTDFKLFHKKQCCTWAKHKLFCSQSLDVPATTFWGHNSIQYYWAYVCMLKPLVQSCSNHYHYRYTVILRSSYLANKVTLSYFDWLQDYIWLQDILIQTRWGRAVVTPLNPLNQERFCIMFTSLAQFSNFFFCNMKAIQ